MILILLKYYVDSTTCCIWVTLGGSHLRHGTSLGIVMRRHWTTGAEGWHHSTISQSVRTYICRHCCTHVDLELSTSVISYATSMFRACPPAPRSGRRLSAEMLGASHTYTVDAHYVLDLVYRRRREDNLLQRATNEDRPTDRGSRKNIHFWLNQTCARDVGKLICQTGR